MIHPVRSHSAPTCEHFATWQIVQNNTTPANIQPQVNIIVNSIYQIWHLHIYTVHDCGIYTQK